MIPPSSIPTLPRTADAGTLQQRQLDVQLARASYNYMFSYLEPVPMSADVPEGEGFTPGYLLKVLPVFRALADNFIKASTSLVEKEIAGDAAAISLSSPPFSPGSEAPSPRALDAWPMLA